MNRGNKTANDNLRDRIDPMIAAFPDGHQFTADEIAVRLRNRRSQVTAGTVGHLLSEREDVENLGQKGQQRGLPSSLRLWQKVPV